MDLHHIEWIWVCSKLIPISKYFWCNESYSSQTTLRKRFRSFEAGNTESWRWCSFGFPVRMKFVQYTIIASDSATYDYFTYYFRLFSTKKSFWKFSVCSPQILYNYVENVKNLQLMEHQIPEDIISKIVEWVKLRNKPVSYFINIVTYVFAYIW